MLDGATQESITPASTHLQPGDDAHGRRIALGELSYHPRYVVWELTLRCDQSCTHCGSRAGDERSSELSTEQALEVVGQLAQMGTREVVLIGGEAYLHPGFLEVVRALRKVGIHPAMTTGGMGITPELARDMVEAGLTQVSVSIDGLETAHDLIRGRKGSFQAAIRAVDAMSQAGMRVAANTNINRVNRDDLEPLFALLCEKGIKAWQVQITVPLGRAADRPRMILQPYDLLGILPRLAKLKEAAFAQGVLIMPGNNLGYFGPEEATMRSLRPDLSDHWGGCQAGRYVMGIESNGDVKGCPSLQPDYIGGNLLQSSLGEIWDNSPALAFTRERTKDADLWGFCQTCPFAETCMAGCSFTSHALFGRPGNNPYCHFRARSLAKQGLRERLVASSAAPGNPFDNGQFSISVEPFDAPEPSFDQHFQETREVPRLEDFPQDAQGRKKYFAQLVKKLAPDCGSCAAPCS
ncbi:MAG: radical SAM protein [Myxococcales bacterium]|nr:radical SAM protein [Myxococcales bacterium]